MRWNQGRATVDKLISDLSAASAIVETCQGVLDEMSPFSGRKRRSSQSGSDDRAAGWANGRHIRTSRHYRHVS
jgi:hypothetical protein